MIRPENLSTVYCKLALSCPWHCVSIGALDLRIYTLDLLHSGWGISYCRPWIVSWLFYSLDRVLHWLFTVLAVLYRDLVISVPLTQVYDSSSLRADSLMGEFKVRWCPPTNTPNTHTHILYMINIHVFILRPKQMPAYMWIYVLDAWQLTFTDYILYIIYTVIENDFWQFPSLKFSLCVSITTIVPVSVVSGWRRLCLWWAR